MTSKMYRTLVRTFLCIFLFALILFIQVIVTLRISFKDYSETIAGLVVQHLKHPKM